jgi:sulfofructosephosphate aldolase
VTEDDVTAQAVRAAGHTETVRKAMERLARPSGAFAMVALDQRESLRAYLADAAEENPSGLRSKVHGSRHDEISDAEVVQFKREALRDLGGLASGVLLDIDFGLPALRSLAGWTASGLVLAADRLIQEPGGPISDTDVDERVDLALVGDSGAVGLKLLVVWRPDKSSRARREDVIPRFLELCSRLEMVSLLEGALDDHTRVQARADPSGKVFFEMTEELAAYRPHIFKTEVPADPDAAPSFITRAAEAVTALVTCPWVLLSSGVAPDRFPAVARAVCAGGASGFLAGRAVWRLALGDGYDATTGAARQRLAELIDVVDATAKPWFQAVGAS